MTEVQHSQPSIGHAWSGNLSVDLRKGALSVSADGLTLIDENNVCWGIIFPDKNGFYGHASLIVYSVNSHATLTARVEELTFQLDTSRLSVHNAEAENDRCADRIEDLEKALSAGRGYLRNASIDLSTGATKATAIRTIEGGIKLIDAVLQPKGAAV